MIRLFFLAVWLTASLGVSAEAPSDRPIYLYGTEFTNPNLPGKIASETYDVIRKAVAPRQLIVNSVDIDELDRVIENKKADIAIVGSAVYRRHVTNGMRDVATLVTADQPDPDHAIGALIVTREDSGIRTLSDLRGKIMAVNHPKGFQGILTIKKEIADLGYDPDAFFKDIRYYGLETEKRLKALRDGSADATSLNVCWAEREKAKGIDVLEGLQTVGVKNQTASPCMTSTELYPNYSLLVSPQLDVRDLRKIVRAVHSMPVNSEGETWELAGNFRSTDDLYRTLKEGPYEYLRSWTLSRIWKEYRIQVIFASGFLILSLLFSVYCFIAIRLATRKLRLALKRQKVLSRHLADLSTRYESAKRIVTVSELSSIVAHELSQPLAAILLYTNGILEILKKTPEGKAADLLRSAADNIMFQTSRADEIVQSVRSYAKAGTTRFSDIDLAEVLDETVRNLTTLYPKLTDIVEANIPGSPVRIKGSALEIELAVGNLIKNAMEATKGVKKPVISVSLAINGNKAEIRVADNGPKLSRERIREIQVKATTTKKEGLGLGLAIVKTVVKDHKGRIVISENDTAGLRILIEFPLLTEGHQSWN